MPSTTSGRLALPYPVASDPPDGPGAFQALANRVETTVGTYSTWLPLDVTLPCTGNCSYVRIGNVVTVTVWVTVPGGHSSADVIMLTLPSGFRPGPDVLAVLDFAGGYEYSSNPVLRMACRVQIRPDGTVRVRSITNSAAVQVYCVCTFAIDPPA